MAETFQPHRAQVCGACPSILSFTPPRRVMKLFVSCNLRWFASVWFAVGLMSVSANSDQQVVLQGASRLAIVDADGSIGWEMPWGGIHDIY